MATPRTPRADGFFMPPEGAPHRRCWMAWPVRESIWPEGLDVARDCYAQIARTIARFEPVTMIAEPATVADVSLRCGSGVGCVPMDHDDSWMRDSGPTFLADGAGNVAGIDWIFNGWGERYTPFAADAAVARKLLAHLDVPRYEAPLVLEGGAIDTDGAGTILTTEAVVFDPRRNGELMRAQAEHELCELLGGRKVIWLGEGLSEDPTGGHVNNLACFVAPGVVLALSSNDPEDANYSILRDNVERLREATDARGERLEVIEVPQPKPKTGPKGERLPLSHLNFYVANGGVIVPMFDDPGDDGARDKIAKAFPKRKTVQVPAIEVLRAGGGIHHITQQEPTGVVEG